MDNSKRFNIRCIVALVLASLIPCASLTYGILIFTKGFIPNPPLLIFLFVLPLATLLCNFFLITSKKKTWFKAVICTISLIICTLFAFGFLLFGEYETLTSHKGESATEKYTTIAEYEPLLPKLSETGNFESIEYYDYHSEFFIFECESDTLICTYSEKDYAEQKIILDEKYIFEQEKILTFSSNCEPVVSIDDYTFRFLSIDEYDIYFPQHVYLIATNDITHEIVYISFYDIDLDYIDSAEDFINTDCGWEHIR